MQREVNKLLNKAINTRERSRSRDRKCEYKFPPQVAQQLLNPVSYQLYIPFQNPPLEQYDEATQNFLRLSKIEIDILTINIEILKKKIELANMKNQHHRIYYSN